MSANVIIINGPLGIGKSSLSDRLNELFGEKRGGSIMLDVDHLVNCSPSYMRLDHIQAYDYIHSTILVNVKHQHQFGFQNIILNFVWETPDDLRKLIFQLYNYGVRNVFAFCLYTNTDEELQQRVSQRSIGRKNISTDEIILLDEEFKKEEDEHNWEMKRCVELQRILSPFASSWSVGERLCTSSLTSSQVANQVLTRIEHWKSLNKSIPVMGFSDKYIEWIISGKKKATTRYTKGPEKEIAVGEPFLAINSANNRVFAVMKVVKLEYFKMKDLTDDIAQIENFTSSRELQDALIYHYPTIQAADDVFVMYFSCVHLMED